MPDSEPLRLPAGYTLNPGRNGIVFIQKNGHNLRRAPKVGMKKGMPIWFRGNSEEGRKGAIRYAMAHDLLGLKHDQEVPK